ncbi:CopG-like domain-containing protein DNA-binding [Candidatus Nitromaritima sp. SCGC AAA799-A02]|nr:CopG-like domain-containing protein DNA-binding [Candidatus Nitromaritima sp. SCGC AAA799-A02]KMP10891.1 CopG-like domain-containing protein DNA-binding [Candidatus Nitromaritima sp. SCGC AAA799-C22]
MKKKVPKLKSDKEAEEFLEKDLTDYMDLKNFQKVSFEFQPKTKKVNIRFPEKLLDAVRKEAKRQGIPYQKFIRQAVEHSLVER